MKAGKILVFLSLAVLLSSTLVRWCGSRQNSGTDSELLGGSGDTPSQAPVQPARSDLQNTVTVLTYSSLGSRGGFLARTKAAFESQAAGCTLQIEATLGANQMQAFLEEPRQQARIDVVLGVDEILFARAKAYFYPVNAVSAQYLPLVASRARDGFYPTDYSALSMIYRKSAFGPGKLPIPRRLNDLLDPRLKNQFIVQDPRASSPGLWFFLFADSIVRTQDLAQQWLSVAPSWDASYKMFLAQEAPMVWSYLTSLAYHASQGQTGEYGHIDFAEGLPLQIEGMAVVNRPGDPFTAKPCVRQWVEHVLSPGAQTLLAQSQYMLPAIANAPIPETLRSVPRPMKTAVLDLSLERVENLVNGFGRAASR